MAYIKRKLIFRLFLLGALNSVITVFLLLTLEGAMNWASFIRVFVREGIVAENKHIMYDPVIGWVNRPGIVVKDMYGPKKNVTILADGTRRTTSRQQTSPRLICSGDSLTFGYGVDDSDAWCAGLSSFGWYAVNMAQGGYGLDQSYLWYKSAAANTQHDVHLAAFFTGDLYRVFQHDFIGYAKPVLKLSNGKLIEPVSPVPQPNELKRFILIHQQSLKTLATTRLLTSFVKKTALNEEFLAPNQLPLLTALLTSMSDLTKERGSQFIAVLLPTLDDYHDQANYRKMRTFVEGVGSVAGFRVIDVGSTLFAIGRDDIDSHFIAEGAVPYFGATGHYTETGNALVAQVVGQELELICGQTRVGEYGCQQ